MAAAAASAAAPARASDLTFARIRAIFTDWLAGLQAERQITDDNALLRQADTAEIIARELLRHKLDGGVRVESALKRLDELRKTHLTPELTVLLTELPPEWDRFRIRAKEVGKAYFKEHHHTCDNFANDWLRRLEFKRIFDNRLFKHYRGCTEREFKLLTGVVYWLRILDSPTQRVQRQKEEEASRIPQEKRFPYTEAQMEDIRAYAMERADTNVSKMEGKTTLFQKDTRDSANRITKLQMCVNKFQEGVINLGALQKGEYTKTPGAFKEEVSTLLHEAANTALEGLLKRDEETIRVVAAGLPFYEDRRKEIEELRKTLRSHQWFILHDDIHAQLRTHVFHTAHTLMKAIRESEEGLALMPAKETLDDLIKVVQSAQRTAEEDKERATVEVKREMSCVVKMDCIQTVSDVMHLLHKKQRPTLRLIIRGYTPHRANTDVLAERYKDAHARVHQRGITSAPQPQEAVMQSTMGKIREIQSTMQATMRSHLSQAENTRAVSVGGMAVDDLWTTHEDFEVWRGRLLSLPMPATYTQGLRRALQPYDQVIRARIASLGSYPQCSLLSVRISELYDAFTTGERTNTPLSILLSLQSALLSIVYKTACHASLVATALPQAPHTGHRNQ